MAQKAMLTPIPAARGRGRRSFRHSSETTGSASRARPVPSRKGKLRGRSHRRPSQRATGISTREAAARSREYMGKSSLITGGYLHFEKTVVQY